MRVLEERVPQGKVFIDSEAEEVPEVVVRDRQHLAEDGFVIVVVAVDSNGRLDPRSGDHHARPGARRRQPGNPRRGAHAARWHV